MFTFDLPNPFVFDSGAPVRTAADWTLRRPEVWQRLIPLAYGALPPAPSQTQCVELHAAVVRRMDAARLWTFRVAVDGAHAFVLRLFAPAAQCSHPVLLNGDGCWHYASDAVIAAVLRRGYALAQFNRVEVAPDTLGDTNQREQERLFGDAHVGAIAAWAWAYHRAVDALLQVPTVDGERIAVVGHSRGGKAALLAGATDTRIAVTSANNSGAGGAGCFRWRVPGVESLQHITTTFPHWFAPQFKDWAGREEVLPFDQHFLKALIAPRALLTTEALGDLWANPVGSWQTHRAAQEVYGLLGVPQRIATRYRAGGHDHAPEDWNTLLDFCDQHLKGRTNAFAPQADPYPGLLPAHHWRQPGAAAAP